MHTSCRLLCLSALLLPLLPMAAHAQQPVENALPVNVGFVSTHATAHRRVANTVVDVSVGIQTQGQTAHAVASDLAQRSQSLLGWLRGQGAERMATDQVSFEPQMHTEKGGQQKIVGYNGSTTVSFRTTPQKVGDILSGVLGHGANTIQQTTYAPTEEEQDKVRRELAQEATKTAVAEAEAVAASAGTRVIGVRDVSVEPIGNVMPMRMMRMAAAPADAAPSIATAPGEQDLTVNVAVRLTVTR